MKYTKDELDIMARNQANINNITHQQWAVDDSTNDIESEWVLMWKVYIMPDLLKILKFVREPLMNI